MRALDLAGRTAFVTGGSRGIGRAAVRALAAAGAEVIWTARTPEGVAAGREALGGAGRGVALDVTDRDGMAALLAPGFDILVNNAGVIGPIGHMGDVDPDAWAAAIATNLVAPVHAIQAVLPAMLARGGGTVVTVSSGAAHRPVEGWSAYCAGKAGLAMATRSLHLEYAARGIRAFALAPGTVDTDMQGTIRASGMNPISRIPQADLGSPDRPGWAIAWLCTAEADALAGQDLDVRAEPFLSAAGLPPLA